MSSRSGRQRLRLALAGCVLVILVPFAALHSLLRASLPGLDGEVDHLGIVAPVTIERDARGVPTLTATNRVDLAYATGFVHGQDRFFQMDLSRRLAAGELSELFGAAAVEQDKKARLFQFRKVSRASLEQGSPEQRAVLEAYARGVNAGLATLRSRPWEYWLLGSVPRPWRPEDSVLVTFAMWWDLQYSGIDRQIVRQEVNARLGGPVCESGWKCGAQFLYPARTPWDAPNSATSTSTNTTDDASAIPPPDVLNVRASAPTAFVAPWRSSESERADIGSNNWAVSGRLTASGAALVANDMHLTSRVPPVWYRARLRLSATETQPPLDLNGLTLPGAPLLVAGSNGFIAWGFTNSYGDWLHVESIPCTSINAAAPGTAGSPPLAVQREEILVHGKASTSLEVRTGDAGVLYRAQPERGVCWFVSWLAQLPAATNMNLMSLERATSVAQALTLAPTIGIPHQNFVVGDRDGHIAWTIAGRIPLENGLKRTNGQSPWTTAESHPRIVDPPIGRIWTANARATDDAAQLAVIGGDDASVGADYDLGARARQIRDDLLALRRPAVPADMLRIQLDDSAAYLARWRLMILGLLDEDSLVDHPRRAQLRQLVRDWNAKASVDAVGYRLVRAYRNRTEGMVWRMLVGALQIDPGEDGALPDQLEPALWRLVNEHPLHMLSGEYTTWRQFLLAQVDAVIAELQADCRDLARCTWGTRRPVRIRHPLSAAVPFLARFLDMPTVELPGDHDMPRVQDGPDGASERFAVSPGHEAEGYIEIPGGESGHPLSAYYRSGFEDWARGTRASFLPGEAQHLLTLRPD